MRNVALVLIALAVGCDGTSSSAVRQQTYSAPEGPVTSNVRTVDPWPQKVRPVTTTELREIVDAAAGSTAFLKTYAPAADASSLRSYDQAFQAWKSVGPGDFKRDEVTVILGAYLGQRMVAELDMEWVLVDDQFGQSYAVQSKTTKVLAFPFASIGKRVEGGEEDVMYGVYNIAKGSITSGDYKPR
jgi:Domain of unknown function (DUF3806)